ncbi:MAG: helix-turn-helix domain-containing protein [archaeon]
MDKESFFRSLGLMVYEAKVLCSLSRLKRVDVKGLGEDSGVPKNKIYSIIGNFEKQGLVEMLPGETKRYRLLNLKTFVSERVKEKEKELEEVKRNAKDVEKLKESGSEFVFSLIKGQRAIMDKLAEHNPTVKKEIFGVQRNWKVWGEGLREMKKATRKGVDVRIIGVVTDETKKRAVEWKKAGVKIKAYNENYGPYPLRFTVFDNKEARITIGKPEIQDPKDYITVWTKSKPLIAILRKQFMEMWKNSASPKFY